VKSISQDPCVDLLLPNIHSAAKHVSSQHKFTSEMGTSSIGVMRLHGA
jgi:hypothetical protein